MVYNADDFPNIVFENKFNEFCIKSEHIADLIYRTSHAVSVDETRPFFNGIYFQELDSKLRAVATDGHRLALLETDLYQRNIAPLVNGIIVPRKGIFELKKIAEYYPEKDIQISLDDSFMHINAENEYYLSIRLIAREYPNYQAGIPSRTSFSLITECNTFLNAIKRIKIMSSEGSNSVKLQLKEREMTITANNPSFGDASEKIDAKYDGKELTIRFNAKYLMDILSTLDNDDKNGQVKIELNNELSQVVVKSPALPNFLAVIMPLNSC